VVLARRSRTGSPPWTPARVASHCK
jgi:hypothetical protein